MMCLQLFLTFLKIGAVSFGGGYGMISVLCDELVGGGWLSNEVFLNFVAVAESTPGPIAINMATFIGTAKAGFPGALCATVGVVLPAFLILLLVAALFRGLLRYRAVGAVMEGIRPVVAGLITATGAMMALPLLFGFGAFGEAFVPDWRAVLIFAVVCAVPPLWKKLRKKKLSPILLILISAVLGILLYPAA